MKDQVPLGNFQAESKLDDPEALSEDLWPGLVLVGNYPARAKAPNPQLAFGFQCDGQVRFALSASRRQPQDPSEGPCQPMPASFDSEESPAMRLDEDRMGVTDRLGKLRPIRPQQAPI